MSKVIRLSQDVYERLAKHNSGFETPSEVISKLLDAYENVQPEEPADQEGHNYMNRKEFVQDMGATCKNWNWSWSFVNHDEKFVLFGAWDVHVDSIGQLILNEDWEISRKGRRQPGYTQALEHLELIENNGYQLKVFKMTMANPDGDGDDPSVISAFEAKMVDKSLQKHGKSWYAI